MVSPSRERLLCLDWLRGLAALLICLVHVPHRDASWGDPTHGPFWLFLPLEIGSFRTVLFIIISGFGIHLLTLLTLAKHGVELRPESGPMPGLGLAASSFWRRRLMRIYGPYTFALVGCLAFMGFIAWRGHAIWQNYQAAGADWAADTLCHVAMVHNLSPDYAMGMFNGPQWALGMEVQLYALYFVYLAMRRRFSRKACLISLFALSAIGWNAWEVLGPSKVTVGPFVFGSWELWPFNYWWIWLLGSLGAEAYVGLVRLPRWLASWRVGVAFFLMGSALQFPSWEFFAEGHQRIGPWMAGLMVGDSFLRPALSVIMQILYFCLPPLGIGIMVFATVVHERKVGGEVGWVRRQLLRAGTISYSLFLVHAPVIWMGEILLSRWAGGAMDQSPGWIAVRLVAYFPACLLVSLVFYYFCERPFTAAGRAPRVKPKAEAPPAQPPLARAA
ncbi:MAG TPA: acyltransferase [Gemmatales bacterium]|nr:acyltransferase [Gemmatales bacterium]